MSIWLTSLTSSPKDMRSFLQAEMIQMLEPIGFSFLLSVHNAASCIRRADLSVWCPLHPPLDTAQQVDIFICDVTINFSYCGHRVLMRFTARSVDQGEVNKNGISAGTKLRRFLFLAMKGYVIYEVSRQVINYLNKKCNHRNNLNP